MVRNWPEVPDQSQSFHALQDGVAGVKLAGKETLSNRVRVVVVVVVPALAQCDQGEPHVVPTAVGRCVATRSKSMGKTVDGERGVEQKSRGDTEAPDEQLRPAGAEARRHRCEPTAKTVEKSSEQHGHEPIVAIQQPQFRESRQVRNRAQVGFKVFPGREPAGVAPEQAVLHRRVAIFGHVGLTVMVAMVCCPPEGVSLGRGVPQNGEEKLHGAGGAECPVREIAVIKSRDGKHADQIEAEAYSDCYGAPADEENPQATRLEGKVGRDPQPLDLPPSAG